MFSMTSTIPVLSFVQHDKGQYSTEHLSTYAKDYAQTERMHHEKLTTVFKTIKICFLQTR